MERPGQSRDIENFSLGLLMGGLGGAGKFESLFNFSHHELIGIGVVVSVLGVAVLKEARRRYRYAHRYNIPLDDWPREWWKNIK